MGWGWGLLMQCTRDVISRLRLKWQCVLLTRDTIPNLHWDKQRKNIGRGNLIEIIKASCWTSFSISLQGGIFNTENHKPQTENCQLLSATADCWFVFSLYSFLFYLMSNISILLTTNWRLLLPTWSRASCSYSEPREFWIRVILWLWVF